MELEREDTSESISVRELLNESPNLAKTCSQQKISDETAEELDIGFTILRDIIKQNK